MTCVGDALQMGRSLTLVAMLHFVLAPLDGVAQAKFEWVPSNRPTFEFRVTSWSAKQGLPHDTVRKVLQTRDGYLWVATQRGLARFDGRRFVTFNHLTDAAFVSDDCTHLAETPDGDLWIGTSDGLLRKRGNSFTRYTTADGLPWNSFTALCAADRDTLWIGTIRGLARFQNGTFRCFYEEDGLPTNFVLGLFADNTGVLWVGLADPDGLRVWRPEQAKFQDPLQHLPSTGRNTKAAAFAEDAQSGLWIAGQGRLDRWHQGQLKPLGQKEGIPRESIEAVTADRLGRLWMIGEHGRLYCLAGGRAKRIGKRDGLSGDQVACVLEDREGNLWIATEDGGLNRLEARRCAHFGADDGLVDENTSAIFQSRNGNIWLGTEAGLTRLENGTFQTLKQALGQPNRIRAIAEDSLGRLWLGTADGGLLCYYRGSVTHQVLPGGKDSNAVRALSASRDDSLWIGTAHGLHRLQSTQCTTYNTASGLPSNDVRAVLEDRAGRLWIGTRGGGLVRVDSARAARRSSRGEDLGAITILSTTNGLSNNCVWSLYEDREGALWIGTERGLNRLKGIGSKYSPSAREYSMIRSMKSSKTTLVECG